MYALDKLYELLVVVQDDRQVLVVFSGTGARTQPP